MKFRSLLVTCVASASVMLAAHPAVALPLTADFIGRVSPGSANVKAPFLGTITQSEPISGQFLFDTDLIPSAASGFINVPFSSIPEVGDVSPATVFHVNLGG